MIITTSDLIEKCKITRQAISKLKLPKVSRGKYDTENPVIKKYLISKGVNLEVFKKKVEPKAKKKPVVKSKPKQKSKPNPKKQIKKPKLKHEVKPKSETVKKKPVKKLKEKKLKKELLTSKDLPEIDDNENESFDSEIIKPFEQKEDFTKDDFENMTGLPARMMRLNLMNLVKRYGGPYQLDKWATILQKLMAAQKSDVSVQKDRLKLIEKDFAISNVFKYIDVLMSQLFDLAESQTDQIIDIVKSNPKEARSYIKELRLKGYSKIAKETKKSITDSLKRMKEKYDSQDNTDS